MPLSLAIGDDEFNTDGNGGGRESNGSVGGGRGNDSDERRQPTTTTMMDTMTTGDSDGGGCPRLFQSTTRIDRVMGDAAYDWRHRNQARG